MAVERVTTAAAAVNRADVAAGEFIIVPRGVEHRPAADREVQVLLFEPATTRNTGNVENERTVERPEWL